MSKNLFKILFIGLLFLSCSTKKLITSNLEEEEVIYEHVLFDTLSVQNDTVIVSNELDIYQPSITKKLDLIHTELHVQFDWGKQYLYGKAYLTLKPYFYTTDRLILDAKGFDIISIKNNHTNLALDYTYDHAKLEIHLDKKYTKNDEISIFIDYIAKPNEAPIGGSNAITSDKGLFFINPDGKDPDKPQQIWTQGETEASSKWFPTIDKPNVRTTQEIYITVQDKYKTLSNGLLISSKNNRNGTRTDYWKMELPHAPYLFMMAVGDFAKVDDQWENIPLSYYVEPAYKSSAKDIFQHTPEMLGFFSKLTGVRYPWPKYAQIIVRDYVSGAMENTTAVIFGEFVQKTSEEIEENNNDYIVAHEMFHHWFGDYVTCESWSNLTLNEGFANYSEYLWAEHKYGRKAADQHRIGELFGYIRSSENNKHPLIHYGYDQKEDMFDAHSYNKGGLILHMLRDYVGDEAFFTSLNKYLSDNKFSAVEADELRMAFEDTTGEDLNWFFNQWFFSSGHPELDIESTYLPEQSSYQLHITQNQNGKDIPSIFILPIKLDFIYKDGQIVTEEIWLNQRTQTFIFDNIKEAPASVIFDKDDVLLFEKIENKTDEQYYFEFKYSDKLRHKGRALNAIENNDYLTEMVLLALKDDFYGTRRQALNRYHSINSKDNQLLIELIKNDPKASIRKNALDILNELNPEEGYLISTEIIETEKSHAVILLALSIISERNPSLALKKSEELVDIQSKTIQSEIANIFGKNGNENHIDFFIKNIKTTNRFSIFAYYDNFQKLLLRLDDNKIILANNFLLTSAKNQNNGVIKKYLATKTLSKIKEKLKTRNMEIEQAERTKLIQLISDQITEIKALETNEKVKKMYESIE